MAKRSVLLGVVAGSVMFGGSALASTAQDAMVPPEATFMYGLPYASLGSDGPYVESGAIYNDAPVYTKAGPGGLTWSLYRRADGRWYVDFNDVSEDWDGTIASTSKAQAFPWSTSAWAKGLVSFRTQQVYVGGIPYPQMGSTGDYVFSGRIHNSAPVYTKAGPGGSTWSLYKRTDGRWYVDFNDVSDDWNGTVAHTSQAAAWPWQASWNGSTAFALITKTVYLYGTAYSNLGSEGEWELSGAVYGGRPVYQRLVAGTPWSLYRRADGRWYVDFNDISDDWDGTLASAASASSWPWEASWSGDVLCFHQDSVTAAGAPYSTLGSAGTYLFAGTIHGGAPVYERQSDSLTWWLYRRADGRWYVDFNDVSEDWDGTITSTNSAASRPWSGTWKGATTVSQNLDE
ncbi:hypothetical protein [Polyangium sorediatum]|uniref:Secreted protein n=1 Tax=Polyangium sorediatum TaxID=889274 RepID=A0ABT6P812_9BACT|nr:hypothetical protein [Polyangium sorediatum]MDI1436718.1 hypothetical protein [Polyangium sorediatum]